MKGKLSPTARFRTRMTLFLQGKKKKSRHYSPYIFLIRVTPFTVCDKLGEKSVTAARIVSVYTDTQGVGTHCVAA